MSKGETIPTDLVIEILSRLPARSIARCRCVSKLWSCMLLRPDFTDLFLTRSSARPPCLLFAARRSDDWCFFRSPHPQNPSEDQSEDFQKSLSGFERYVNLSFLHYNKDEPQLEPLEISSSPVTADFHMKFPGDTMLEFHGHASGFIHFHRRGRFWRDREEYTGICNPSTGQYVILPLPTRRCRRSSFLGFDPIDKQFKVLCINTARGKEKKMPNQIMTLGTGNDSSWRNIHCPLKHYPRGREGICINGVLYYFAEEDEDEAEEYEAEEYKYPCLIVCFDVRSEKFKFIYNFFSSFRSNCPKLINYKGKLAVLDRKNEKDLCLVLVMWVIKDVENPESQWEKYFRLILPDDNYENPNSIFHAFWWSVVGMTPTGEIVLSHASKPLYVIYIDPETKTIQRVEIQGLRGTDVEVIADYVEDLTLLL